MRGWVKFAVQTTQAEFPSFSYWSSLKIFNGGARNMDDASFEKDCERLAKLPGVSRTQMAAEVLQLEPM
eukprot:7701166-Pyramimonas_sp.AAC.1